MSRLASDAKLKITRPTRDGELSQCGRRDGCARRSLVRAVQIRSGRGRARKYNAPVLPRAGRNRDAGERLISRPSRRNAIGIDLVACAGGIRKQAEDTGCFTRSGAENDNAATLATGVIRPST